MGCLQDEDDMPVVNLVKSKAARRRAELLHRTLKVAPQDTESSPLKHPYNTDRTTAGRARSFSEALQRRGPAVRSCRKKDGALSSTFFRIISCRP